MKMKSLGFMYWGLLRQYFMCCYLVTLVNF